MKFEAKYMEVPICKNEHAFDQGLEELQLGKEIFMLANDMIQEIEGLHDNFCAMNCNVFGGVFCKQS